MASKAVLKPFKKAVASCLIESADATASTTMKSKNTLVKPSVLAAIQVVQHPDQDLPGNAV